MSEGSQKESHNITHLYASIAHEINNPLTIIDGYAEIIQSLITQPQIDRASLDRFCAKMRSTIKRVSRIVNGLKEMALSAESDPTETLNLAEIIHDAINLCADKISAAHASIETDFGSTFEVLGHSWQLVQVFCNLINNACDAVSEKPNGRIVIKVAESASYFIATVEDSGPGIPPPIQSRVFYPFYTTKAGGTGMGLALCRQFIGNHGGTISIDSSAKQGRFVINLPRTRQNPPSRPGEPGEYLSPRQEIPPPVAIPTAGRQVKMVKEKVPASILVVDDESEIVEILEIYLAQEVTTVKTTTSPLDACRLIEEQVFDLIITDVNMLGMNGYQLIAQARKGGYQGQVIIISGSSTQMPEEAAAARVDSVFNKPINFAALISRIRHLLGPEAFANSRRQFERMLVDSKLRIKIFCIDQELFGSLGDIGYGGFFFSGPPQGLYVGSEVSVRVYYLDQNINRIFEAKASVRWLVENGAGCQFQQMEEGSINGLNELINFVKTNISYNKS